MIHVIKKFLSQNGFEYALDDFEDYYTSHPNYPSLFSITDSLDVLNIENVSIKIPKEQFEALPDHFVCLYKDEFVLAAKTASQVSIEKENGVKSKISFDEFLEGWNTIVLLVEPNETKVLNLNYKKNSLWFLYGLPILILVSFSVYFRAYNFLSYCLLGSSLLGLLVSVFILQESFGIKNEMVSKFCEMSPTTSCDSVITSSKGKIVKELSFSDLPFLFFATTFLSLLLNPVFTANYITFLCVLCLPVIAYSIWLQKMKIKKWCVLCLVVSLIIVLQSLGFSYTNASLKNFNSLDIFTLIYPLVLVVSGWIFVKSILKKQIKNEKENKELKKFKRNFNVFQFLTKEISFPNGFESLEGVRFGSRRGVLKLTLIISPSCGHCHKAFKDAYELVKSNPDKIDLQILFNINPENKENPFRKVVESILSLSRNKPKAVEEAIVDWHIKNLELDVWEAKWGIQTADMLSNHEILKQYNWCFQNEFNYTPVKLINGKIFPKEYDLSELKYFINNFSEETIELELSLENSN